MKAQGAVYMEPSSELSAGGMFSINVYIQHIQKHLVKRANPIMWHEMAD